MNAQQLKNAILQEAIEGRLVPQDPNDEPASVLLERIREEKKRLVKEGKLKKKDLEEIPISEDEKPFEIPESWEWVRLKYVVSLLGDGIHGTPEYDDMGKYYFINGNNLSKNKIVLKDDTKKVNEAEYQKYKKELTEKTILVSINGTIGNVGHYNDEPVILGKSACYFNLIDVKLKEYVTLLMYTDFFLQYAKENATGSTIKNVSLAVMNSFVFPLPPLAEQKRIVAKIEELLPKVEEYGKAQDALNKLNEELPDRLKKSILQEAITGRLVPQDPNDEPASVLLDKIRAEKKQLFKEGKLKKKDLEETPISEDEKPFDIPESWEWCKLNDLCIFLSRGKSPSYSDVPTNYPVFAQKCNLKDGGISLEQARFLKPETVSKWQEEYHLRTDDVLVNSTGTGTVCRTRLFNENCLGKYPFTVPDSHVSVVRTSDNISSAYICFLFNSKLYQDYWEDRLAGSTNQKELYIGVLQNTIIPLPPLAEQKRIVAKIEEVFKEIDKLKK